MSTDTMSTELQLSILANFILTAAACVLYCLRWWSKTKTNEALDTLMGLELQLAANKAMLNSSYLTIRLARDLAKKNQERWMKFRYDMIRLRAVHEFATIDCGDALERAAIWHQLADSAQAEWLKRGADFVEKEYGSWVG